MSICGCEAMSLENPIRVFLGKKMRIGCRFFIFLEGSFGELTESMRLGMLPSQAMISSRETASELPTTSETLVGRYFSTHGIS